MRRAAPLVAALAGLLLAAAPAADAKRVRVFAAGPRVDLSWAESKAAFSAKLTALLDARRRGDLVQRGADDVASHLLGPADPDRPVATARDLVTLPEDVGLLAAFAGGQGRPARGASDANTAIASLLPAYASQMAYYAGRFPELGNRPFPPTRTLALALTDTFGRVAVETFAELADRYDTFLAAGVVMARDWRIVCTSKAAMPKLPGGAGCDAEDPARVALLRAPDEPARPYAYEATTPRPSTMALVFDPDGRLISKQVKAYLTPVELPGQLDIVPGDVSGVQVVPTPVGRLGFVTSKDAWMPDVVQKLDQQRVEVLVQPEFFVGDTVATSGPWAPDTLKSSGYADLLRHPSFDAWVLPEMVGNLLGFSADAQQAIGIKPRTARAPVGALVGQPPAPGLAVVSPWVVPDPAGEPFPKRRRRLGEAGAKLLPSGPPCPQGGAPGPCRGGHVEGVLFADVNVDAPRRYRKQRRRRGTPGFTRNAPVAPAPSAQRNVTLAARGPAVWAAFEERRDGRDTIVVARSGNHGARFAEPVAAGSGWWPSISAGPGRELWLAWQDGDRVRVARSTDDGRTFGAPLAVDAVPDARQWRPSIAATGRGTAVVAWVDERGSFAGEPGLRQSELRTATVDGDAVAPSVRIDAPEATSPLAASLDHAWAPSVAARGADVLVTWIDFADYDWDVWARRSPDGGRTWGDPVAVNDTPRDREALADRPQAALTTGRRPLVAWTDWRKDPETARTPSRLHDTLLAEPGRKAAQVDGDGAAHRSTFSPALATAGSLAVVAWQSHERGNGDIHLARAGGRPLRVDDAGRAGWNAWRPAVVVTARRVVVAWEDERDGPPQIYVARAAPERVLRSP